MLTSLFRRLASLFAAIALALVLLSLMSLVGRQAPLHAGECMPPLVLGPQGCMPPPPPPKPGRAHRDEGRRRRSGTAVGLRLHHDPGWSPADGRTAPRAWVQHHLRDHVQRHGHRGRDDHAAQLLGRRLRLCERGRGFGPDGQMHDHQHLRPAAPACCHDADRRQDHCACLRDRLRVQQQRRRLLARGRSHDDLYGDARRSLRGGSPAAGLGPRVDLLQWCRSRRRHRSPRDTGHPRGRGRHLHVPQRNAATPATPAQPVVGCAEADERDGRGPGGGRRPRTGDGRRRRLDPTSSPIRAMSPCSTCRSSTTPARPGTLATTSSRWGGPACGPGSPSRAAPPAW